MVIDSLYIARPVVTEEHSVVFKVHHLVHQKIHILNDGFPALALYESEEKQIWEL
jgi:hypothetical protein